nr:PREDICTED: partner and localizer of BRCA2 isoform X2 [Latimeria chalumnae]|eukprot:XP_014345407.1 PREDICTED: partner and localizer of BRCA2 isoform X2 [Latimeria chalumnae]
MLHMDHTEQSVSGAVDKILPSLDSDEEVPTWDTRINHSQVEGEKKMTVSFNLEPEVINVVNTPNGSPSVASLNESLGDNLSAILGQCQETKKEPAIKSKMKLKRNKWRWEEKELVCERFGTSVIENCCFEKKIGERHFDEGQPVSPVFKKNIDQAHNENSEQEPVGLCTVLYDENELDRSHQGKEKVVRLDHPVDENTEEFILPTEELCLQTLSMDPSTSSPQFESQTTNNGCIRFDVPLHISERSDETVEPPNNPEKNNSLTNEEIKSGINENTSMEEDTVHALIDTGLNDTVLQVQTGKSPSKATDSFNKMCAKSKLDHNKETSSSTSDIIKNGVRDAPVEIKSDQIIAYSTIQEKPSSVQSESPLSSCTLIEGLLFPVEYYVRTTRRMSMCQRKVDLDAVIHSYLGKTRGRRRKLMSDLNRLDQEVSKNDTEFKKINGVGNQQFCPSIVSEQNCSESSGTVFGSRSPGSGLVTSHGANADRVQFRRRERGRPRRLGVTCTDFERVISVGEKEGAGSSAKVIQQHTHLANDSLSEKENDGGKNKTVVERKRPAFEQTIEDGSSSGNVAASAFEISREVLKEPKRRLQHTACPVENSMSKLLELSNEALAQQLENLEKTVKQAKENVESKEIQIPHIESKAEHVLNIHKVVETFSPHPETVLPSVKRRRGRPPKSKKHLQTMMGLASLQNAHLKMKEVHSNPLFPVPEERFSIRKLSSSLDIIDFHLPDEEFGLLKLEKLKVCAVTQVESFTPLPPETSHTVTKIASKDSVLEGRYLGESTVEKSNQDSEFQFFHPPSSWAFVADEHSVTCELPQQKKLCASTLVITPECTVQTEANSPPAVSSGSAPFPSLSLTPVVSSPKSSGSGVLPVFRPPSQIAKTLAVPGPSDSVKDEKTHDSLLLTATPDLDGWLNESCWSAEKKKKHALLPGKFLDNSREPEIADQLVNSGLFRNCTLPCTGSQEMVIVKLDDKYGQENINSPTCQGHSDTNEETLKLISTLKNHSHSCGVDLCSVWWDIDGRRRLNIVIACENSVSLWESLQENQWENTHTWDFTEVPVIQIVSIPEAINLICVALGKLEIGEIRTLFYSREEGTFRQSLLRSGDMKIVLGLTDRRVVSCNSGYRKQNVELISLSEEGRNEGTLTLMSPGESILAFAEVDGEKDALIATTDLYNIVLWNIKTGQLLQSISIGNSYPTSLCLKAFSDSGLLFAILCNQHNNKSESSLDSVLKLVAINPKKGHNSQVLAYTLPAGFRGQYLDGDVSGQTVAAVLTSGAIVLWDLLYGHCTAQLAPETDESWSLVRWANLDSCLLAGQKDGHVLIYEYLGTWRK